jgi:hypothetical protein
MAGPIKQFGRKALIAFFKKHKITYSTVQSATGQVLCVTSGPFPKLNFQFDEQLEYIKVWRIGVQGYIDQTGNFKECQCSYCFPDTDPYRLIKKLLERRVIRPQEICRIKF